MSGFTALRAVPEELDFENNVNNGKKGWWVVMGLKHSAYVYTDSAVNAAKHPLTLETVKKWELTSISYLGPTLDDLPTILREEVIKQTGGVQKEETKTDEFSVDV